MTHSETPWYWDGAILDAGGHTICDTCGFVEDEDAIACVNAIGKNNPEKLEAVIKAIDTLAEYHQ